MRYGSCPSVIMSHSIYMLWVRRNETSMTLFNPLTLKVGTGNCGGICIGICIGKVSNEKIVGKGDSEFSKVRCRVQVVC